MKAQALRAAGNARKAQDAAAVPEPEYSRSQPGYQGTRTAEAGMNLDFLPDTATLVSFLINALYLFGDNALIAQGGIPAEVTAELTRIGHKLAIAPSPANGTGPGMRASAIRSGRAGPGRGGPGRGSRYDRALFLAQPLGVGSDGEILDRLRDLRRAVKPGGLICFHIFERDRAWNRAGRRFDPVSGRISARAPNVSGRTRGGASLEVKTWNRSEIESLLRTVGLRLERAYADWKGAATDTEITERLIVVACKPRNPRRKTQRKWKYEPG